MSLTNKDKEWINSWLDAKLERLETTLLTEFQKMGCSGLCLNDKSSNLPTKVVFQSNRPHPRPDYQH